MAPDLCSERGHEDADLWGVGGLSPGDSSGSLRKHHEGNRAPFVLGTKRPPSPVGRIMSPSLPAQLPPTFRPAPSGISKHAENINLSPAIHLSWRWPRQYSLDVSPRAESGSARADNGFQHIGRRSDLMRTWRPRPPPALAAAGCCLSGTQGRWP